MFAGFDNRELLPPFFPAYRNQDGIYGDTLDMCISDACTAHIPLVLQHFPNSARTYRADGAGKLRVCDWVKACCSSWAPGPGMASPDRMRALGAHLESLGGLPERAFKAFLMPILFGKLAAVLNYGDNLLKSQKFQPEYWANELVAELNGFSSAAVAPDYLTAIDINPSLARATQIEHIQKMVRVYGQILIWWPEIVRATRELADSGITLGREL